MNHNDKTEAPARGRGWALAGVVLGGAVSVMANVAHSFLPPSGAGDDWTPATGAVAASVFWPVALFVAAEILTRITWPEGRRWTILRFVGLLPVALVAAVVSYRHLSGLLTHYGEDTLTAVVGPLAVDGLMVMATGALLATGHARTTVQHAATDAEPVAVAVEAATTTAADADTTTTTTSTAKRTPARTVKRTTKRTPATGDTAAAVAALRAEHPDMTQDDIATRLGVSTRTVRRHLATTTPDTGAELVRVPDAAIAA